MIVYTLSDQHGFLPVIEEPHDLLLIAGDICPDRDHTISYQREWLDTTFREWLLRTPSDNVVAVAGNHDFIFDDITGYAPIFEPLRPPGVAAPDDLPWHYLQDQSLEVGGYKIYGTPWQPTFGNWAFNAPESKLAEKFSAIPSDTDILLVHGPPFGFGDKTIYGEYAGSKSLRKRVAEISPELVICGHIHEAHGTWHYASSRIVNTTIVDESYIPIHSPMRFELDDRLG